MKPGTVFPLLVLLTLIAFGASTQITTVSQEQLTEQQAADLFQQIGCVSCHMPNGAAKSFEEILNKMANMAAQYNGDIDAYTRETVEYFGGQKFNSYDEMMEVMQANVGASDEDMAKLNAFFKSYFEAAAKGEVQQPAAGGQEETPAQQEQEAGGEAAPQEQPAEKPKSNIAAIVFGVAAIIIIAVLLVVFTARK